MITRIGLYINRNQIDKNIIARVSIIWIVLTMRINLLNGRGSWHLFPLFFRIIQVARKTVNSHLYRFG